MAQRVTTFQSGFLQAEDADPRTNLSTGALAILDGAIPDRAALHATLGERIGACPRFAQRLQRQFLDLGAPRWVDDGEFNLADHIRTIAVPAPGSDDALFQVVAELMSWRLDRDRPLWEIWIIDGLAGNRWAMLVKVHPSLADGIATAHILTGLADDGAHPVTAHDVEDPPRPATATTLLAGLARVEPTLRGTVRAATDLLRPASPLNGPVTARRRYVAARVDLAAVRRICRSFEVTVDDVALAALTESYRAMLINRGDRPRPDSLRTLVSDGPRSVLLPRLPVDEANPVLRLRKVAARITAERAAARLRPANPLALAARALPFPVTARAMNLLSRLPQRSVAALAIHLPGPPQRLQVMGSAVIEVLPIPPIAMQLRTGAAILPYADRLYVGILADFTVVDADILARGVETAIARLLSCSRRRRAGRDRRGLSLVLGA